MWVLEHGYRVPNVPVSMELSMVVGSRQTGMRMQGMVQGSVVGVGMVEGMGVVVVVVTGFGSAL